MAELKTLVDREMERAGTPGYSLGDLVDRRSQRRRTQRIAAALVAIALFAVPVWFVSKDGSGQRAPTPAATGSASAIVGLPPEGAAPSVPEHGELVMQFGETWVYADGRVISAAPPGSEEPPTGLIEQRLTPAGIEILRSAIVSTGLFDHDLALARAQDGHAIDIYVRNGDRLVRVIWAVRLNGSFVGESAPLATPHQADALEQLDAFLSDPASWPASVWEDPTIKGFVPSMYSVCVRAWPHPMDLAMAMGQLPEPAQDLLRTGELTREPQVSGNDCSRVSTDDARSIAQMLDAAEIPRWVPNSWLQWRLVTPDHPESNVVLSFGAVLPHGDAISLGLG